MDRYNNEQRSGLDRRKDSDSCPLSPECADRLIIGHEELLKRMTRVESTLDEIHDKIIHAKGFLTGMRIGAASVFILIATFIVMVYGLLSGKITIKDIFTGLF